MSFVILGKMFFGNVFFKTRDYCSATFALHQCIPIELSFFAEAFTLASISHLANLDKKKKQAKLEMGLFCLTFRLVDSSETWEKLGKAPFPSL